MNEAFNAKEVAFDIMYNHWPGIASALGECDIRDLVDHYAGHHSEIRELNTVNTLDLVAEVRALNFGQDTIFP